MTVTTWKVSVFEVILVRIFPYPDWIRRDISISPYLVWMRENADQNNSEYRHILRSLCFLKTFHNLQKRVLDMNIFKVRKFALTD